jgi:hypothetical protein
MVWVLLRDGVPEIDDMDPLAAFGEVRPIERLTCSRWDCEIVDAPASAPRVDGRAATASRHL